LNITSGAFIQHELRLSIEHQMQVARGVEPQPDAVDQATSGSEKESVLQRIRKEQQLVRAVGSALGRLETAVQGSACPAVTKSPENDSEPVPLGTVLHSVPRRLRAMS
jgi:hypothetical protein